MDITEVRKVVGKIRSNLFKNSNFFSVGMMKSHFRGSGLQFKEHQVYSHGDDVRLIDWNMLAKTSHPYIKTFEEERNIEILVYLDTYTTMFSGYNGVSKLQASLEICCLLYLLASETGDRVRPVLVGDEILKLPSEKGERGIIMLVSALEKLGIINKMGKINLNYRPKSELPKGKLNASLMADLKMRKEIVLLSDFNEFVELDFLKRIIGRSHIHCFQIISPLDEADVLPYSIYSANGPFSNKGNLSEINFRGNKDYQSFMGRKFKKLKVQERYLEEFIKEML
jgi:hypothetical protein